MGETKTARKRWNAPALIALGIILAILVIVKMKDGGGKTVFDKVQKIKTREDAEKYFGKTEDNKIWSQTYTAQFLGYDGELKLMYDQDEKLIGCDWRYDIYDMPKEKALRGTANTSDRVENYFYDKYGTPLSQGSGKLLWENKKGWNIETEESAIAVSVKLRKLR